VFLTNAQRADAEVKYGRQDNFFVIPHPVLPALSNRVIQRDPKLVVMLARPHYHKRLDHAIRAFAEVLRVVPDARLEIYGRGPEEAHYQRQIDKLRVGDSVKLAGYTNRPDEIFQRAALSLLTSRIEGFALVVLESLKHGCPVISYDIRYGPSEIISDGVDGVLVEEGDVDGMAREIVRVLTTPSLDQRLSEAALSAAERFSPDVFIDRWSALFNTLDAQGWG
jgi:poly(glycerol-phosphate) alpha-glucosyltransferase